jgi:aspartate carbamoyltransferase catalytic subunit
MHPGPVNRDVDIDGDLLYKDKSLIANQIENGVFVRMAMIEYVLG